MPRQRAAEQHEERQFEQAPDRFVEMLLALLRIAMELLVEKRAGDETREHAVHVEQLADRERQQRDGDRDDEQRSVLGVVMALGPCEQAPGGETDQDAGSDRQDEAVEQTAPEPLHECVRCVGMHKQHAGQHDQQQREPVVGATLGRQAVADPIGYGVPGELSRQDRRAEHRVGRRQQRAEQQRGQNGPMQHGHRQQRGRDCHRRHADPQDHEQFPPGGAQIAVRQPDRRTRDGDAERDSRGFEHRVVFVAAPRERIQPTEPDRSGQHADDHAHERFGQPQPAVYETRGAADGQQCDGDDQQCQIDRMP